MQQVSPAPSLWPAQAWHMYVLHRRKKATAQQLFTAATLQRALRSWLERARAQQRLQVKEQHLRQQAARRLLAAMLVKWRRTARAHAFLRRYFLQRAWATWVEHALAAKV